MCNEVKPAEPSLADRITSLNEFAERNDLSPVRADEDEKRVRQYELLRDLHEGVGSDDPETSADAVITTLMMSEPPSLATRIDRLNEFAEQHGLEPVPDDTPELYVALFEFVREGFFTEED